MLQVRSLTIEYQSSNKQAFRALNGVDFALSCNSVVGLMGESGCGKTTLAMAMLGLFQPGASVVSGSIRYQGDEIIGADETALRRIRGAAIALVFQDAATSLNPVMCVGDQVSEVVRAHESSSPSENKRRAQKALESVRLEGPRFYSARPHELSAGQRQRVALAQALVCEPSLLIADEPTSALDNSTQFEILSLLTELRQRMPMAILLITHDPTLLAGLAERILVMYGGAIVEEGASQRVLDSPSHPYTAALLRCVPPITNKGKSMVGNRLNVIRGYAGSFPNSGCSFQPRCPLSVAACVESVPPLVPQAGGGLVRCFRYGN